MTPRPRDLFGRPLPADADVPVEADPEALPPDETLQAAAALLADGRAFRAHEVFEAAWKATRSEERELWRGLAQLAVGITHAQRGNVTGSGALLRRAAETLERWDGQQPYGVDVTAVRTWARDAAEHPHPPAELLRTLPRLAGSGRG
jgi:hypothetical protein